MMAASLICSLEARGFKLAATGGRLRIAPASALTDRDRERSKL
jgi:hypothetical protein